MRQDLVLTNPTPNHHSNAFRLQSQTLNNFLNAHPSRQTRSSSLPLKIISQKSNSLSDKLIRSWNGTYTCTRLCMYTHLSVSDYCINLIGNDLPINSLKSLAVKTNEDKQKENFLNISSDESSSDSCENIDNAATPEVVSETESESVSVSSPFNVSSSEAETDSECDTQFKLDEDIKEQSPQPSSDESNPNDLTITIDSKEVTDSSSGYASIIESKIETDLDETYRNLEDDISSCDDDLFKDFMPKKSCLKKLFIDTSDLESVNATSSPLNPSSPTSPTFSLSSSSSVNSTSICSPNLSTVAVKKRVSFADNNGKELFTVRTMSEPSNCPPKLTSKIVEYFLNREFNNSNSNLNKLNSHEYYSNYRNYDYGISALNYTNDMSSVQGSIAVYSLNFAQPAGDYLKFRKQLDEKNVCLENVLLNRFSINGTIKVKNINFQKHVFIRCSFNNWASHEDFHTQYVPSEYYSTPMGPSSPTLSAAFYGNNPNYQPHHKDYDTFRFNFELPKTVDQKPLNTPNNTIQFCVCFKAGASDEYWDNNSGLNYEILQYVIDIEKLKPNNQDKSNFYLGKAPSAAANTTKQANTYFRYDSATLSKANYQASNQSSGIYY